MATSISGIHGQLLEVTVVGCNKLKDTEWFSRQDPYVCLEYGSSKFRTRTCTDGGKNPTFQEKFVLTLIEGLRELNVLVWNSNTVNRDDLIGSGKVQLQKVLSQGYDDSPWSIQTKTGRYAGDVRLIMHFQNANSQKPPKNAPSAPSYAASPVPQPSPYSHPPPASSANYTPPASAAPYPHQGSAYPTPSYPSYPHNSASHPPAAYPPTSSAAYSSQSYPPPAAYPAPPYPPPAAYPAPPYPPPAAYPAPPYPPPAAYPPGSYPPTQPSSYYPPGTYPPPY